MYPYSHPTTPAFEWLWSRQSSQTETPTRTEKITQNTTVGLAGVYLAGVHGTGERMLFATGDLHFSQLPTTGVMWECESIVA